MTAQKANPRRATRRYLAAADMRAREEWLAHDDRCGAVTGGCCNCTEWDDFDYDRAGYDEDDCYDCHGTGKCWACGGYNPGDDLGSGCSECDGWGNCWCGS